MFKSLVRFHGEVNKSYLVIGRRRVDVGSNSQSAKLSEGGLTST